ncbi:hypothetical protein DFH08DRAFT_944693 [Mycena albidolilacea]|uniref:Uncharacterized protein n=1 Tax=Mycena albidolilacea TaxID=1033008 RepID=A0AAD6Z4N1_9AGAR|nr:hypothetical protein DFH08DRAFT_944693 [Mycena albidolilacea]
MDGPAGPVFPNSIVPEALDAIWQKDVHEPGKATCPKCGLLRGYGTAGVVNLVKKHLDKEICKDTKKKQDKEPRKNGSLKAFFKEKAAPIATFLKSTVRAPSPIRGAGISAKKIPLPAETYPPPAAAKPDTPSSRVIQLLDHLRANVELLPSTIPDADVDNPLSEFAAEPTEYVSQGMPAGELWEALSPTFHRVFGYGMGSDERKRMVQRGSAGLDGTLRFLDYFIRERGLEGGMVELKIEQLIEAVQSVLQENDVPAPDVANTSRGSSPAPCSIIDLDAMDVDTDLPSETPVIDATPASRRPKKLPPCGGYIFPFKADQTASSDYPFRLHDTSSPPWEYSGNNDGVLTLRSINCVKLCKEGRSNCRACADLPKHPTLQGILQRAEEGIPESANYAFNPISGLIEHLRRKNGQIKQLRMRGFNAVKRIAAQTRSLTDHKRFVRAIGSRKVENVDRLVRVQLGRKQGIRGLLSTYDEAAKGVYQPKSFTEEEDLRGVLLWKLAGNRVADFAHRALGLPSRTTLRKRTTVPPIVPSPGRPQVSEVADNVKACFEGIADVLAAKKPKHAVLMFDEIATERRIRWDPRTNNFLGVCREHANKASLQFNGEKDLEELFRAKEEGKVHFAGEATVAAIGMLSEETRLYAACPVLISGDCKKESGREHLHSVLNPTINGVNSKQNLTGLCIVSVTSDGETRRGKAFIDLTFDHLLSDDSDIYDLLKDLEFMDFWVGEDDLTPDKDHKHMFKRGRNRLTRALGMKIFGVQITPAILRVHFQSAGLSSQHIHAILNPDDKQDVKLAFDLLKDIWSLPPAPADARPGFASAREAVRIIGSLFYHLLFPYVCVDLTLSEQLEHLSAAAHLLLLLYRDGQKDAIPTLLYTDIMIMIKNAYFCVAKAKVDDPTGKFWLILLGTDRLEELFGILRTMIGNDRNLDVLQLVERITGSTEVANILAMYPHWDRPPRRLQLPTLARDSSWRGDTTVANVTPLTCWNRGRRIIEQECPQLAKHFRALDASYNVNILSPLGELIVHKELDPDDNEDDDEEVAVAKSSVSPDLEDAAIDEDVLVDTAPVFTNFITVQDKPLRKTRALALMQKFGYNAKSTDRLKRVADVQRYSAKGDEHAGTVIESDAAYILVSEPIATLVRCEEKLFAGIGEVTDIQLDGKSLEQLSVDSLRERKVTVHFQILSLVPATDQDAPEGKHDWRSTGILRHVLSTPGRLVLPVDPAVSTRIPGKPYYLFESGVLRALGAQLLDEVTLGLNSHIPKCTPTPRFPYREPSGLACFVCEGESDLHGIEESDSHMCLKCTPPVVLDVTHPQTVLTHIGAHILHDSTVDRSTQPCGFCCRPFAICHFALKKTANGMTVKLDASKGCSNFVKKFNYGVAAKMRQDGSQYMALQSEGTPRTLSSPHSRFKIPRVMGADRIRSTAMRVVWEKLQAPRKKKTAKKPKATLAISAAHSSRLALIDEQDEVDSDESYFINDSPIQTPEPSDNEDDMLGQPMPSGGDNLERPADLSAERPPSPLEYFPEPDALRNHIIAAGFSAHPESDRRDSSASIDMPTGIAADRTDSGSTQQPSTAASDIPFPSQDPPLSVPSQTLLASIQPPNPAPPVLTDPGTRRSNRKRKERDGLEDLAAALEACICGSSAAPEDES